MHVPSPRPYPKGAGRVMVLLAKAAGHWQGAETGAATAGSSAAQAAARIEVLGGAAARERAQPEGPGAARPAAAQAAGRAPARPLARRGMRGRASPPRRRPRRIWRGAARRSPARGDDWLRSSRELLASLEARARDELAKGAKCDGGAVQQWCDTADKIRGQVLQATSHAAAPQPQLQGPQSQHSLVLEMQKDIRQLTQGGDAVPVPQVRIAQRALDFKGKKKSRTPWPFGVGPTVEIKGLKEYVLRGGRVGEGTFRQKTSMGLNYFFRLIDIGKANYSDIGVVQALNDQGVLADLCKLRIMDPCFTWQRKILDALKQYIAFMLVKCKQNNFGPARKALEDMRDGVIEDALKASRALAMDATQARLELDWERLGNYMTKKEATNTLREAMGDLLRVQLIHQGATSMTPYWQYVASVTMAQLMVIPGTFGRSCELAYLTEREVLQSREAGRSYVTISDHKTVRKHGKLGRHLVPITWKAVEIYTRLPPLQGVSFTDDNRPFLRPSKPHQQSADVYHLLKTGGRVYNKHRTFPRTTLQRKMITTAVRQTENSEKCEKAVEECKELVAKMQAHSMKTANRHYDMDPPEEQAARGMTLAKIFFGADVEWPKDERGGGVVLEESKEDAEKCLRGKYGHCALEDDEGGCISESDDGSDMGEWHAGGAKPRAARAPAREARAARGSRGGSGAPAGRSEGSRRLRGGCWRPRGWRQL